MLVLLFNQGQLFAIMFQSPYIVKRRGREIDCMVKTPEIWKSHQLCHVNMLNPSHHSPDFSAILHHVIAVAVREDGLGDKADVTCDYEEFPWLETAESESGTICHTFPETR